MANNQEWQRRTDDWIKMTEASKKRKERERADKERCPKEQPSQNVQQQRGR